MPDHPAPDEASAAGATPIRVALCVTWTRKRRALTMRFGVLELEPPMVALFDRDGTLQFRVAGPDLRVAPIGKTKVSLTPPNGEVRYVTGFTAQEANRRPAREMIARHQAIAIRPPSGRLSLSDWKRVAGDSNPWTAGTSLLTQRIAWQPKILAALWECGAREP